LNINSVKADGYKNLCGIDIALDKKLNIFCGDNAQGKTNLIESIWLCTGCKSFRGTRDKDFIGFNSEAADICLDFSDSQRTQEIVFKVKKANVKDKTITLNGVKLPLLSRLFGSFKAVIFTPEDLELSKGSPDNRRTFVDLSVAQIKPSYVAALNKYNNILVQRNALLKNIGMGLAEPSALDIWDEQLAKTGAYISVLRYTYCTKLNNYTNKLYSDLTQSKENLQLYYQSTIYKELDGKTDYDGELFKIYYGRLKNNADDDIRAGFTLAGVHRDDIITRIDSLNTREFGSQGQARSVALVMKLAQAQILTAETGEAPVMLLDDVLSELDISRQRFILGSIDDMQVLITCCDSKFISEMSGGKVFYIKNGQVEGR
jgi:DNA replication and repair protein RecF